MCNQSCIEFGRSHLRTEDVRGKSVIEVGSLNVNGSLRRIVEMLGPSSYAGVDIEKGPGVDEICNADNLIKRFGQEAFDLVISTELLEHVQNWQKVISNFKNVLRRGGILVITTRSIGFPFHPHPFDFWRFQQSDMRYIFSDFCIEVLENDPEDAGIFIKVRKPRYFKEVYLGDYPVYSIIKNKRVKKITNMGLYIYKLKGLAKQVLAKILPKPVKDFLKRMRCKWINANG